MEKTMDHPALNGFLFYPRTLRPDQMPRDKNGSVHSILSGSGEKISAYLYQPLPEAPIILMFHGNGEVITDYAFDFSGLSERLGANIGMVDYRGYGLSEGEPSLSKILEDGRAAWKYFTETCGMDGKKILLLGRSMGSIPAIDIASRAGDELMGLVVESGIADFDRWIERLEPVLAQVGVDVAALKRDLRSNLDHKSKIQAVTRPMLIIHTEGDNIVPSGNARDLCEWAGEDKAELKIFPEGDHNTILVYNLDEYMELVKKFMEKSAR